MPNCHTMAVGETYVCEKCGLKLEVVGQCHEHGKPASECKCPPCTFVCCGQELSKAS